jgi:hypothetical protein
LTQRVNKTGLLIFLMFVGHIFLPLSFILQLRHPAPHDMLAWVLSFYTAASYITLVYVAGVWSWFGNASRYALTALLVLAAVATYPHTHTGISVSSLAAVEPAISVCVGAVFTVALVLALLGRNLSTPALELAFPLRGGTYYVAQGGSNRIVNMHVISPSQRYALDILKLNAIGVRARGLYPADPKRYAIFGAEIVSPCDGVVAAAEDGFVDLPPPERDPEHRAGNFVAIESDGATIYLAHLMKGSVSVKSGEHVRKGQVLGRVGNSGNTTEPHLHIHAEEGSYPGRFSGKRGIPIRFNGRFLIRNDTIKVPV